MSKNIFITGTGTDVGKTFVTGLILKKLNESGVNAAYYKAAMSGNARDENGNLIPGDALFVKNASGISQPPEEMCPYIYENAVSPHLASQIEGKPVEMNRVLHDFDALCRKYDYIAVEGSGGISCPLRFDCEKIMLTDVIKSRNLCSIIVADAGLGTINHAVLTAAYMKAENMPVKGIIFNRFIPGDRMHEDNIKMCRHLTGLEILACVKPGDSELCISAEALKNLFE